MVVVSGDGPESVSEVTEVDNGDESAGGGESADTPDGSGSNKKKDDSGAAGAAGKNSGDGDFGIGALAGMMDNLDQFVLEPSPKGCVVKCRITRDRKGMDRGKIHSLIQGHTRGV